jgi:hypothetical protein
VFTIPILAFTMSDLGVHVAPIPVFTFDRSGRSRSPGTRSQQALNHTVSGVRVRSKIVPAVTELRPPHPEHLRRPSPSRQPPSWAQPAQAKPAGHLSHSR